MIQSEIDAIHNESGLHRETPYMIANVRHSQLSISKHYGGCRFQGEHYFYDPVNDTLVRHDVLRWITKYRKAKHTARLREDSAKQMTLEV